jgi:hypothetical protein
MDIEALEELGKFKRPMILLRIEPATFLKPSTMSHDPF